MSTKITEVDESDPLGSTGDWIQDCQGILDRLTGRRAPYKRSLIIKVVSARLLGKTLSKSLTPAELSYWSLYRLEPLFLETYDQVMKTAMSVFERMSFDNLRRASHLVAINAPQAALAAIEVLNSDDERTRLSAAFGLLDRAGVSTASKSTINVQTDWRKQAADLGLDPSKLFEAVVTQMMTETPDANNSPVDV
jgi:hypothetical protein